MKSILLLLIMLSLISGAAWAQGDTSTEVIEKPVGEAGRAFTDHARRNWQRTDAVYQSQKADLQLQTLSDPSDSGPSQTTTRVLAALILAGFAVVAILVVLNNRLGGGLFSTKPRDEALAETDLPRQGMIIDDHEKPLTLAEILALRDPKAGLRALLVQALHNAAQQNQISLRRSLTAREIVRLVPSGWPQRAALIRLVSTAEVVLFGAGNMTPDQYAATVQAAAPLIGGVGSK